MSYLYQTNVSAAKTIKRSLSEARVNLSFYVKATSPSVYPSFVEGEQVVLNTDGTVSPRTAASQVSIGVVIVPNTLQNGHQVTVAMRGNIEAEFGATGGAIVAGTYITSVGINTSVTPNRPNAATTTTGQYADGIALTGGSLNTSVKVLVLAAPVYVP